MTPPSLMPPGGSPPGGSPPGGSPPGGSPPGGSPPGGSPPDGRLPNGDAPAGTPRPSAGVGKLVVLMITAFVDMVGLLMVLPLLPFYVTSLGGDGIDVPLLGTSYRLGTGQISALLVTAYTVAQLASAPLWGRFSDRFGRRPALMIALTASMIAYVIFAYSTSLWVLFLSRLVQGAGGGTVGVIQAYVADATHPKDRAKSLGWLSAATNAGVALGPVLGSWTMGVSAQGPGLIAAALCFVNVIFCGFYLTESHDVAGARGAKKQPRTSRAAVARVVTHSGEPASRLIWIYAVAIGAFQGVTSILALFLAARYGVTAQTIGYFFMYIGVISVLTRAVFLGRLVDRLGEAKLSRIGLVLMALGLGLLPLTTQYWQLAIAVALMPLGTAFTFPCVTAMLSRVISNEERGLYMGVQQTFGGASRAIYPLIAGFAFDHLGIGVPFAISAVLVAATLLLGFDLESYAKH